MNKAALKVSLTALLLSLSTPTLANSDIEKAITKLANSNVICKVGRVKDSTPTIKTCYVNVDSKTKVTMSISEWAGNLEQWIKVEGDSTTARYYVEEASLDFMSAFNTQKKAELQKLSKKIMALPLSDHSAINNPDFNFQLPSKSKVLTKGYYFITTSTSKKLKL